jgi:hypothetical protein
VRGESLSIPLPQTQLIRLLGKLLPCHSGTTGTPSSHQLGQLFSLADAVILSRAHATGAKAPVAIDANLVEQLTEDFLRVRGNLMQSIAASFLPENSAARLRFPASDSLPKDPLTDPEAVFEPYRRFYMAHQRDMETQVRSLWAAMRQTLQEQGGAMQCLAVLDAAMDETLWHHARRCFATIPGWLGRRFESLLSEQNPSWPERVPEGMPGAKVLPDGLAQFARDVRAMLLAELDVRLLPVLGLLEALREPSQSQPHFAPPKTKYQAE